MINKKIRIIDKDFIKNHFPNLYLKSKEYLKKYIQNELSFKSHMLIKHIFNNNMAFFNFIKHLDYSRLIKKIYKFYKNFNNWSNNQNFSLSEISYINQIKNKLKHNSEFKNKISDCLENQKLMLNHFNYLELLIQHFNHSKESLKHFQTSIKNQLKILKKYINNKKAFHVLTILKMNGII